MAKFLVQGSYSAEAWAGLVKNPHDRQEAVGPIVQKLGGRIEQTWFSFDTGEIVTIADLPDATTGNALLTTLRASGAITNLRATALVSSADAVEVFRQAGGIGYQPPG